MISYLEISDFTLIDNLKLELNTGMSVITGETGAGKSILLEAISQLFGARANTQLIRNGCAYYRLQGCLKVTSDSPLAKWLQEHEIDDQQECILRRSLSQDGRSRAFVNGQLVNLQTLRELAKQVIEIHGQHEYQGLFKRETQRTILDSFGSHQTLLSELQNHYQAYRQIQSQIDTLQQQANIKSEIELLQYQLAELDDLNLQDDEIQQLHDEQRELAKADNLLATVGKVSECLSGNDASLVQQLQSMNLELQTIAHEKKKLISANELIAHASMELSEAADEIEACLQSITCDPARLYFIETRLDKIHSIARKHQVRAEELVLIHQKLRNRLNCFNHNDEQLASLELELQQHHHAYEKVANSLSNKRHQASKTLSRRVSQLIQKLGLPHGQFSVNFIAQTGMTVYGAETVEFIINTNPGQAAGPLNKIASGGELSRVSLALQTVIAQHYQTPITIFDEVDVGIGGATAEIVGQLLKTLGQESQVLCITHLPQVAAQGCQHYRVNKYSDGKTTTTELAQLDKKQRIDELARMLGGQRISPQTIAHAKELLA